MKLFFIGTAFVLGCGIAGFFFGRSLEISTEIQVENKMSPIEKKRIIKNPIPGSELKNKPEKTSASGDHSRRAASSLPPLDESDQDLITSFGELIGEERLTSLFNIEDIARRIVVTIDNATRARIPTQFSFNRPLENNFIVDQTANGPILSHKNFARYDRFVELFLNLDTKKILAIYLHYYPLFQSAYQELGTQESFNNRLIEVIDNSLLAPNIKTEIKLEHVGFYEFSDSELESCSVAQKILIRMGSKNAIHVKQKLLNIKRILFHLKTNLK